MKYSDEFIAKVKKAFPDSQDIHNLADIGHPMLGRWLNDSCSHDLSINWLLAQTDIKIIHDRCKREQERLDLYREWHKSCHE